MALQDLQILILVAVIVAQVAWLLFNPRAEGFEDGGAFSTMAPATDHTEMTPAPQDDDPRDLPWFASWSPADRRARRGQNCNVTNIQDGPDGTMLLTTTKSCEDGLPHTRVGDRIIIPDNVSTVDRQDTIRHELIHVYQRRNPEAWAKFYQRNWSFVLYKKPPANMPRELVEACRSNPDTWDPLMGGRWSCWMGRWWPLAIYRDAVNPRLRDVDIVFWDAWRGAAFKEPPQQWHSFFGTPGQTEHPHELAATLIVAGDTQTEAGRRINTWWDSTGRFQARSVPEILKTN